MTETLYKLMTAAEWEAARDAGDVPWSADDRRDGFMHLSTAAQVLDTARRHYAGVARLVALEIDDAAIEGELRFELAPKRGEKFPHLYGRLPTRGVRAVRPLAQQADGSFGFADGAKD